MLAKPIKKSKSTTVAYQPEVNSYAEFLKISRGEKSALPDKTEQHRLSDKLDALLSILPTNEDQ